MHGCLMSVWNDTRFQERRSLWDRRTCHPNIYEGGTSMVMPPPNILEVMSFLYVLNVYFVARFILSSNSNNCCFVCCILMQILCVVSHESFSLRGLQPWTSLGGLPSPRSPVFFYVPPIILWDRRPCFHFASDARKLISGETEYQKLWS